MLTICDISFTPSLYMPLKWSPKLSSNINRTVCPISLSITSLIIFHCQSPVSVIAFHSFGVKILLGKDCIDDNSMTPFSSPQLHLSPAQKECEITYLPHHPVKNGSMLALATVVFS